MIRGVLIFFAGVVLGAVVAVATTVLIAPQPATTPAAAPSVDSVERFGREFEDAMSRALQRVQREGRAALSSQAPSGESSPAPTAESPDPPPRRRQPAPPSDARDADSDGTITRDTKTPLREKNAVRLNELFVRTKEAQSKRRREWMFVSESDVGAELGLPDRVNPNGDGGETWVYDIPYTNAAGDVDNEQLEITLLRGRVIRVDGAEAIPEQR